MTKQEVKNLERRVLKYITTKRGGKHYKTFELMYEFIEYHKVRERFIQKIAKEIGENYIHM